MENSIQHSDLTNRLKRWRASIGLMTIALAPLSFNLGCAGGPLTALSGGPRTVQQPALAGDLPTPFQSSNVEKRKPFTHQPADQPADQIAARPASNPLPPSSDFVAYRPAQDQQGNLIGSSGANRQSPFNIQSAVQSASIIRGQSPDGGFAGGGSSVRQASGFSNAPGSVGRASQIPTVGQTTGQAGSVQQATYQYPELATQGRRPPGNGLPSPDIGSPNQNNPLVANPERGGVAGFNQFPNQFIQPSIADSFADLNVQIAQTSTGRINIGGAFNSDNGLVGQFTIDEKDFDITRFPRSFDDIFNGTAFRGGGQAFRLELVPGNDIERYLVSLTEPYLLGTDFSFSASGFLFERRFFDYDEARIGGRLSVGRRLSPDVSFSAGLRLESVELDNPRLLTSPELNASLGQNDLFLFNVGLIRDTRDSQVAATQGTYFAATFHQAFGDFVYSRGDLEFRRYHKLRERADRSGRHTLSYGTKLGFTGSETPVFENFFAGGFSTIRGFDFRGASPVENGIRVGGEFQWLSTIEYQFPLTADDMIKGVLFCDFGTVEQNIEINSENFRVAPGFGFRVNAPAAGLGAPLAFDFAFPVATAEGDDERVFSFFLGIGR